jgi:hypothetical protein
MSLSESSQRASSENRFPISLDRKLDHKLLGYAAAASAAGVGILALTQSSQAEIVYTPTHQTLESRGSLPIDLNNDGITDFTLSNFISSCGLPAGPPECSEYRRQTIGVNAAPLNQVLAGYRWAPALPAGENIGPGKQFFRGASMQRCDTLNGNFSGSSGPWRNVNSRYLGLSISVNGQTYYGWARLTVTLNPKICNAGAILTGYAYETVAGKAIAAGQTSGTDEMSHSDRPHATLGGLALGSAGLVAWRRDEVAN